MYILKEVIAIDPDLLTRLDHGELLNYRYGSKERAHINHIIDDAINRAEQRHGKLVAVLKFDDKVYLYQRILEDQEVFANSYRTIREGK